tara:strand:- start:92 stop:748 length:657 start_codon:yes stop_codon:yes gene_type:complete
MTNLQDFKNRSEVGVIKPWGKATAPVGYLLCNGAAVSRTTYAELFVVIATVYGAGNGSTTFNVPQLQGKTPQGYDGNTYNLAGTGGANTVTVAVTNNQAVSSVTLANNQAVTVTGAISNTSVSTAQLASHSHTFPGYRQISRGQSGEQESAIFQGQSPFTVTGTANSGSGTGHTHSHTLAGTITGTVAASGAALSGTVTSVGTNSFSPYVVVNYIIKH